MKVNREIRAEKVRVITEKGEQLGIMTSREALAKAEEAGLDLVEVSSGGNPPVVKIVDYGKLRYNQQKKEKDSKKAQVIVKVKEVKLKPNIDDHDFETKLKKAREFVLKGNKVRLSIMFRGREMLHIDLGQKVVDRFCEGLSDIAARESSPKMMGRTMSTTLAPTTKKIKSGSGEKNA